MGWDRKKKKRSRKTALRQALVRLAVPLVEPPVVPRKPLQKLKMIKKKNLQGVRQEELLVQVLLKHLVHPRLELKRQQVQRSQETKPLVQRKPQKKELLEERRVLLQVRRVHLQVKRVLLLARKEQLQARKG